MRCQTCSARDRTCQIQKHTTSTCETVGLTSRARIRDLENSVDVLWNTVRRLEAKIGDAPTEVPPGPSMESFLREDSPEPSPNDPPAHLLTLFDNDLLDPHDEASITPPKSTLNYHNALKSSALWALMPSRQDLLLIAADASKWMTLFNSLFPNTGVSKDGSEMISAYDWLQQLNPDPVAVASVLLSIAITVKQAPQNPTLNTTSGVKGKTLFVTEVSDVVERTVISDDDMLASLEGIACGLLFVRL